MKTKLLGGAAAALALAVALSGPASAHVAIEPSPAAPGAEQTFAFRVPNELDDSTTVKVDVKFPTDRPIVGVAVEPVPGWKVEVKTRTLAKPLPTDDGPVSTVVSEVIWSGGSIGADQFQRFPWVGTLPDEAGTLAFPTIQTYANGKEVSWIQPVVEGQDEPDDPTPTLTISESTEPGTGHTTTTTAAAAGAPKATATKSSVDGARTLGIVGIVAGVLGLALAGVALTRKPRAA